MSEWEGVAGCHLARKGDSYWQLMHLRNALLVRNAGKYAAVPVAAITATSLPVAMTECGASDSVNVSTSDAGIVKVTAALPSSASRSRKKLALMGDDSRPVSMADVSWMFTCLIVLMI